jgi:hypothetical protein
MDHIESFGSPATSMGFLPSFEYADDSAPLDAEASAYLRTTYRSNFAALESALSGDLGPLIAVRRESVSSAVLPGISSFETVVDGRIPTYTLYPASASRRSLRRTARAAEVR